MKTNIFQIFNAQCHLVFGNTALRHIPSSQKCQINETDFIFLLNCGSNLPNLKHDTKINNLKIDVEIWQAKLLEKKRVVNTKLAL